MSFNNEIWLAIRPNVSDGGGSELPSDSFAAHTPESFGDIMRPASWANSVIRLGPGVFRTRGFGGNGYPMNENTLAWRVRKGGEVVAVVTDAQEALSVWPNKWFFYQLVRQASEGDWPTNGAVALDVIVQRGRTLEFPIAPLTE